MAILKLKSGPLSSTQQCLGLSKSKPSVKPRSGPCGASPCASGCGHGSLHHRSNAWRLQGLSSRNRYLFVRQQTKVWFHCGMHVLELNASHPDHSDRGILQRDVWKIVQATSSTSLCQPAKLQPPTRQWGNIRRIAIAMVLAAVILYSPAQALAKACCEGSARHGFSGAVQGEHMSILINRQHTCFLALRNEKKMLLRKCRKGSHAAPCSVQVCWTLLCTWTST